MPEKLTSDQRLASLLHSFFCLGPHLENFEELSTSPDCTFYVEEAITECWTLKAHALWLQNAEELLQTLEITPEEALQLLTEAVSIIGRVEQSKNPAALNWLLVKFLTT